MSKYKDDALEHKKALDDVSKSFCLAKWLQSTTYLSNGTTHSCHHPPIHKIPLEEIKSNPRALHNTAHKKEQRRMMMNGERPPECSYCWSVEDSAKEQMSDRYYKSSDTWAAPFIDEVLRDKEDFNGSPRYLEVAFTNTCNFTCSYCSPRVSSAWAKDVVDNGFYPTFCSKNDVDNFEFAGLMPIKVKQGDNPYVQAFWEWWPELYKDLSVFRITGGEPLMDKNTFKVLDHVIANPNKNLKLSVTSNMCPTNQSSFDRFLEKVSYIVENKLIKKFALFVSLDSVGEQLEYSRFGADYNTIIKNVEEYLKIQGDLNLVFINTFNIFSVYKFIDFLKLVMRLRETYGTMADSKAHFDIPILRDPPWQAINNLDPLGVSKLHEALDFMNKNSRENHPKKHVGFRDYEIDSLKRNIAWLEGNILKDDLRQMNMHDFYAFFNEFDQRRGLSLPNTFPELRNYWNQCYEVWKRNHG